MILALVTLWLRGHKQEPAYQRKSLTQWLYNEDPDYVRMPNDVYGHIHNELWEAVVNGGYATQNAQPDGGVRNVVDTEYDPVGAAVRRVLRKCKSPSPRCRSVGRSSLHSQLRLAALRFWTSKAMISENRNSEAYEQAGDPPGFHTDRLASPEPTVLLPRPRSTGDKPEGEVEPSLEDLARDEIEKPVARAWTERPAVPTSEDEDAPAAARDEGRTAFTLYLREIGQVRLLRPDEEIELAGRIKRGDRQAREELIKANLRLVVKIARDYEGIGLPLLDLISEGNIGLMKAVERFDPAKGAKLSTYASWWIKQAMKRALATQSKTIRVPVHMLDKLREMRRIASRLHERLGREPADEELAIELGITPERVAQMRAAASRPASLDAPMDGEDSSLLGEVVEDEKADTPYELLEDKALKRMLAEMVRALPPRQASILNARFGLDGGPPQNLEQVGVVLGITRERVRQIQNSAFEKLRRMIESREAVKA